MNIEISKHGLDRAGKIIRLHKNDDEYRAAIETLNRWHEQHILPMDFYFDACVGERSKEIARSLSELL